MARMIFHETPQAIMLRYISDSVRRKMLRTVVRIRFPNQVSYRMCRFSLLLLGLAFVFLKDISLALLALQTNPTTKVFLNMRDAK